MVACAGTMDEEAYEPVPQAGKQAGSYRPYSTAIDLGDASVAIFPVVLSERLRTIYGPALVLPAIGSEKKILDEPVRIRIWVELRHGLATADLSKAAIILGEAGRTLYPSSVERDVIHHYQGKRSESIREKLEGPIQMAGQRTTHMFVLTYGILTTQLQPFALHIPDIHLNGRSVTVKPIAFERSNRETVR